MLVWATTEVGKHGGGEDLYGAVLWTMHEVDRVAYLMLYDDCCHDKFDVDSGSSAEI